MTYGEACNSSEMESYNYLPEGLVEGCTLKRAIKRDQVITYSDVRLPQSRLADTFRVEQTRHFFGVADPERARPPKKDAAIQKGAQPAEALAQ